MNKESSFLREFAERCHYPYNKKQTIVYGEKNGYKFVIWAYYNEKKEFCLNLRFFIKGERPIAELRKFLSMPIVCEINLNAFMCEIRYAVKNALDEAFAGLEKLLDSMINAFDQGGFYGCDALGKEGASSLYLMRGAYVWLCDDSVKYVNNRFDGEQAQLKSEKENIPAGLAGAFVSGLGAAIVMLILSVFGYVSNLAVLLLVYGLVNGYLRKGVKLSYLSGTLIVIMSALMSYAAIRASTALRLALKTGISFGFALRYGKTLMQAAGALDTYYGNFLMVCGVSVIATAAFIIYQFKKLKEQFELVKIA